MDRDQLNEVSG